MRLGIDLAPLASRHAGVAIFSREILPAIHAERPDWTMLGFNRLGWRDAVPLLQPPSRRGRARRLEDRISRAMASAPVDELVGRAREWRFASATRPRLDLFYALASALPGAFAGEIVPVVHDLYRRHPGSRSEARLADTLTRAVRIQAVSAHVGRQISERYGVDGARIDVVPPAVRSVFFGEPRDGLVEAMGLLPGRYWLAVGMTEKRRNLGLLVRTLAGRPDLCSSALPLILTGSPSLRGEAYARDLSAMIAGGVVGLTPRVDARILHALYANAAALLVPSLEEASGLQVLEALACGTPVIAADTPAIAEAAGGHAVLLPGDDPEAWAAAMRRQRDIGRTAEGVEAGWRHARAFTAKASARAAVASLERALL